MFFIALLMECFFWKSQSIAYTRYSTSRWQLLSENINLWKIQSQQQSSKPVAQNEVPVDFIAVYLSLLWESDVQGAQSQLNHGKHVQRLYTIIWKLSCRFQVKLQAQSEAPVDFEVFAYVIAVNASCVIVSRGCNKLFRSYHEGFRTNPWLTMKFQSI